MIMDIIKARHSIRKYTGRQISLPDLEKILEAGTYAPNAGGGQRSLLVAVHNKELTTRIGKMNLTNFSRSNLAGSFVSKDQPSVIDDPAIKNGFYDAPTVVCIFCQADFIFNTADAFCMAENMILQATELGIASCIISRGKDTFESAEGQKLLRAWNVPENYSCQAFVVLGYIDGEQPARKSRQDGRARIVG